MRLGPIRASSSRHKHFSWIFLEQKEVFFYLKNHVICTLFYDIILT